MTVAELSAAGVPAVLVPLPGAPGDHQTANARVLERAGSAVLLPDDECTGDRLAAILDGLLDDPASLADRGRAARAVGQPEAAAAGARVVEVSARRAPQRVAS
jgi:UDP-N-acetylglucosamine--N-acetylmuramyl-(pentapeptide) pyrophosphoryl-undecaprenol N-acetylglucosamine transferase